MSIPGFPEVFKTMNSTEEESKAGESSVPFVIHLPGFIKDDVVGLGEIIKRATAAIGIPSCDSCGRRARLLSRFVAVSGSKRR